MTAVQRAALVLSTIYVLYAIILRKLIPEFAKSFPCRTPEKSPRKSFICHTYDFIELKVLYVPLLRKKHKGWAS